MKDTEDPFFSPAVYHSLGYFFYYRQDKTWNPQVISTKSQIMGNLYDRWEKIMA